VVWDIKVVNSDIKVVKRDTKFVKRVDSSTRSVTDDPALNRVEVEEVWEIGARERGLPGHNGGV
jgi:hypothetical protein